jgi:thiamine biosynthesis lipoprotein
MESVRFRAMNTDILLAAEGQPDQLMEGFDRARQFIVDSEARFTRFSEDSELSGLNRSSGAWFRASPDMISVISIALSCFKKTQGLFDPSILPDLQRAGYDRSMDLIRTEGVLPAMKGTTVRERVAFNEVKVDFSEGMIQIPAGMMIDLGGIAKGWIAEGAARILSSYSPACGVNAGGDMFLVGLPAGEMSWQVSVEDPRNLQAPLTVLEVGPGAVTTSSITKRAWKQDGQMRHHLIDPRSGEPAATDWLSVTVIAPHAYLAEVYAKALLIAGSREAGRIVCAEDHIAYLAVDQDGNIQEG